MPSASDADRRSSYRALALGTVSCAALALLDGLIGADLASLQALPVLLASLGSGGRVAAAVAGVATLALHLGLWIGESEAALTRSLTGSVTIAATAALGVGWSRRESRRLRVAAAAAACAADLLRRHARRFRAVLDSTHDPLMLIDGAGLIQAASPSMQRVFGMSALDLVGHPVRELLPALDLELLLALPSHSQTGSGWAGELEAQDAAGRRFPCEVTAGRVVPSDSEPEPEVLFLLHLRDVTHRRSAEVERLHSRKMQAIGQLAAGIAHEINTPIQYVSDNLRFLERGLKPFAELTTAAREAVEPPPESRAEARARLRRALRGVRSLESQGVEAVREALEGVDRVAAIVRAMRSFSHPGTAELRRLDLHEAIRDTLTVSRHEWKDVARVETHLAPDPPMVLCMPGEIHQVLLNLIVNAAHAIADLPASRAAEPGRIEISTDQGARFAEIRIRDEGTGFPESIRDRLFEPFFTTKEVGRGTGQGLAIAHSVVHRHGGTIECSSRVGEGSLFVVRLPIDGPRGAPEAAILPPLSEGDPEPG